MGFYPTKPFSPLANKIIKILKIPAYIVLKCVIERLNNQLQIKYTASKKNGTIVNSFTLL